MIQRSRLFEIIRSFMNHSFKDIEFQYHQLTPQERELCTGEEWLELMRWLENTPPPGVQLREMNWEDEEDASNHWTRDQFVLAVGSGGIVDNDGCGYLATKDVISDVQILPSDIDVDNGWYDWPEWATHVVWYNK